MRILSRITLVRLVVVTLTSLLAVGHHSYLLTASEPVVADGATVVSASEIASEVGADVMRDGGNAVDAAVASAFAMAVTYPSAGNIGGGGFLVFRSANGEAMCYDFREMAPAATSPTMFLTDGKYDYEKHHHSHLSVGVPGTVDGLHLAWKDHGTLPWRRLIEPAIVLARDGFPVPPGLAQSLAEVLPEMKKYPASFAHFSNDGQPYRPGELLKQPDLANTLKRIAAQGPSGFYDGVTARLIEAEMQAGGGIITRDDLKHYRTVRRDPVRGTYRGFDIISMPPPSSGGIALIEMLNILEGYDLAASGFGSAETVHLTVEAMRRAYADRARFLGDLDFNPELPISRLTSKEYADELRETIDRDRASKSSPESFEWNRESVETTHLSVVDAERNAVSLTYTLEQSYGSKIVVTGGGFLLNNEMGDFNPVPDQTTAEGLIGTKPNLAAPRKRMLSSMTPTIVTKDGRLFMVTGSPGGRTIINTVLLTIINAVDFGMNAQEAVDAGRYHHQWLPDVIRYEEFGLSPDTIRLLEAKGHELQPYPRQGLAEIIIVDPDRNLLEAGVDHRQPDGGTGIVTSPQP